MWVPPEYVFFSHIISVIPRCVVHYHAETKKVGPVICASIAWNAENTLSSPYATELETRVKDLETHVEESEAIIRQLRTEIAGLCEELAAAQVQLGTNSAFSNISTPSSLPSDVEGNVTGFTSNSTKQQHDASVALQTLRTGLHSVSEPPPAPHPDDLLNPELERKVGGVFRMPAIPC